MQPDKEHSKEPQAQEPQPVKLSDRRASLIDSLLRTIAVLSHDEGFIEHLCTEDRFQVTMEFKNVVDRYNHTR